MSYSTVDPILECWAKTHGLIIHKIFKDVEVRSIEIVSPHGKRFQIWIEEPDQAGNTCVHVWDMKKKKRDFTANKTSLKNSLEEAYQQAQSWF
jgi:hypothetical protein